MDLKFITTPEEDALLQKLSDDAMIGRGNDKQPDLEAFTNDYFHAYLNEGLSLQLQVKRNEVKQLIDSIGEVDLDNVKQAIIKK